MTAGLPPLKSRSLTATFVTLQRDPPLTRIFAPGFAAESINTIECEGFRRRAKIAVARPAAPAPTIAISCVSWFRRESESRNSSATVLSGRSPPSFALKPVMDLHPAVVDLVGCGKAFYANGAGRISNDDFVTRAVGLRSDFALNGLVAALEEVEHAADYCTGCATRRLSLGRTE